MSKEAFVNPAFTVEADQTKPVRGLLTAVRIVNDINLGTYLSVEVDDLVRGVIYKDGKALVDNLKAPITRLGSRMIATGTTETIKLTATDQALVVICRSGWYPDCEIAHMLALGSFFPFDVTKDNDGIELETPRELFWDNQNPTGTPSVAAREIDFYVSGDGLIKWSHLGISGQFNLAITAKTKKSAEIILLVRNQEKATISLPACFGPKMELRLPS